MSYKNLYRFTGTVVKSKTFEDIYVISASPQEAQKEAESFCKDLWLVCIYSLSKDWQQ